MAGSYMCGNVRGSVCEAVSPTLSVVTCQACSRPSMVTCDGAADCRPTACSTLAGRCSAQLSGPASTTRRLDKGLHLACRCVGRHGVFAEQSSTPTVPCAELAMSNVLGMGSPPCSIKSRILSAFAPR